MPPIDKQDSASTGPFDKAKDVNTDSEMPYDGRHRGGGSRVVPKSYTSQGNINLPHYQTSSGAVNYSRDQNNPVSNSINFEKKSLVPVTSNLKNASQGQFHNSGKSWKGTLGPQDVDSRGFPAFYQTHGTEGGRPDSTKKTAGFGTGTGHYKTGKWGGGPSTENDFNTNQALEPTQLYEWDLDGRRHIKGTIPKVNISNLLN